VPDLIGKADAQLRSLAAQIDDEEALPEELQGVEAAPAPETDDADEEEEQAEEEDDTDDEPRQTTTTPTTATTAATVSARCSDNTTRIHQWNTFTLLRSS